MFRLIRWLWSAFTMSPTWGMVQDDENRAAILRDGRLMAWAVRTGGSWRYANAMGDIYNIPFKSERDVFQYACWPN